MNYTALYRKYRPQTFDDVKGQTAIVQTLRNQIIYNRIGHAYLFSGPRGTGKTSLAKIFAKAINCQSPIAGSPCLQCECCKHTSEGLNIDIIEIDAASNNGVDNVRDLIDESKYVPQYGKYKVYIIDEVHMLSSSAFNALLKTLEEPTSNVVFILATTEEHKVPKTISSRCQRFTFKLIKDSEIIEALQEILSKENIEWEDLALDHIAKLAKGGLRDALSLLDQCLAFINSNKITLEAVKEVFGEIEDNTILEMVKAVDNQDVSTLLDVFHAQISEGKYLYNICMGLYEFYKDAYLHDYTRDQEVCNRYMRILAELSEQIKYGNTNTISIEIALIKLCKPQMETDYSSLYQRINQLENVIEKLLDGQQNISFEKTPEIDYNEFISFSVKSCRKTRTEVYYD